jgi:hypothetical protein
MAFLLMNKAGTEITEFCFCAKDTSYQILPPLAWQLLNRGGQSFVVRPRSVQNGRLRRIWEVYILP